jgi:uncharacterized membrane protein HdeD (DUF308 family)
MLGWALFMSPNIGFLSHLFAGLFGLTGLGNPATITALFRNGASLAILVGIPVAFSGYSETAALFDEGTSISMWKVFAWGALVAICILLVGQVQNFIYVGF